MCKQSGRVSNKDEAMAAQTRCVLSLCLPRMRHHVEPSRTQASYGSALRKAAGRVAKGGWYAWYYLSDRLPLLRSDENEQTNTESTELKLQTKFFAHKNTCICLFAESAGVWRGVQGSLRKVAGAKLAWLRFSEFLTHGS